MDTIEALVFIIITIVTLPDICAALRRPALLYCGYIVVGCLFGQLIQLDTTYMLQELGTIGFIILLFLIGLEIEIPSIRTLHKSLRFCLSWVFVQILLLVLVGWVTGIRCDSILIAAAGISACSLSVAYGLIKGQTVGIAPTIETNMITEMVILEVMALIILALSEVVYAHGWSHEVVWHSMGLIGCILALRFCSGFLHNHFSRLVESSHKWNVHYLLMIVFVVAIVGQKLGLSAAKTAFFLGLFMSATSHNGMKFEDQLNPIAKGVLIPIFFLSLGSKIPVHALFSWALPLSMGLTGILFALRWYLFRTFSPHALPGKYFLFYCPNITMVAVAAEILLHYQAPQEIIDVLLISGLIITIIPAALFPTTSREC